jgi:cytoskeleton protein RodZ
LGTIPEGDNIMESTKESGLGFFLKSERERKGLSLEHLAKVTRLRVQYIEALETEDWDKLPSQVFIKGFIKTYAKALGLEYREVMAQFESTIPVYNDLPKTLIPSKKTNKKFVSLGILAIVVIVVIVSLIIVFFTKDTPSPSEVADKAPTTSQEGKSVQTQVQATENKQDQLVKQPSAGDSQTSEKILSVAAKPETSKAYEAVPPSVVDKASQDLTVNNIVQPSDQKNLPTKVEQPLKAAKAQYTLSGFVTEKTYIKIYVDNNPPKEYLFPKGSLPQWTAQKGFYILVGNAAGIEFDLNGKRIKALGGPGVVVRLKLPENVNIQQ